MTRIHATLLILAIPACLPGDGTDDLGGQSGEENIVCGPVATTELADDEASVLGFGRTEIAAFAEGDHGATLSYDEGGSSPLTLSVSLGSARYHDMDWVDDGTGAEVSPATEMACADIVEIDASVGFSTEDGAFAEAWTTTLDAAEASSASFWVDLDLDALSGSFSYAGAADFDDMQTYAWGSLDASGTTGAVQAIGTTVEDTGPDGTVSGTQLTLATW